MEVSLLAVLGVIGVSAGFSRFIQRSRLTEGLRASLGARSALLDKLLSCPHCLCFWVALACAVALARTWFQFVVFALLGWRGGYYLNRLLDRLVDSGRGKPRRERSCQVCGMPWNRAFFERQGLFFCSYRCWFDYLREMRREARQSNRVLFDDSGNPIRQDFYPASFENITPARARELLDSGEGYVYIDVRSTLEFENGHPAGAVNIPLLHYRQGELVFNPDFLRVVEANFSRDTRIIVGCQIGARSVRAAEALVSVGFTEVFNVVGGFNRACDQEGRVVEEGWFELGLPVEYGEGGEKSYQSLVSKRAEKR